jgi:hypothetical protein
VSGAERPLVVVQQWNLLKPAANEVIVDCRFAIANFRSGEVSFSIDNRQSTIDNFLRG